MPKLGELKRNRNKKLCHLVIYVSANIFFLFLYYFICIKINVELINVTQKNVLSLYKKQEHLSKSPSKIWYFDQVLRHLSK